MGEYNRYRYLDYLRALAIIPVLFIHYQPALLPGGSLGVNIFFVLSGFFIAKQLLVERPVKELVPTFLIRRMLRILPPYYFVLTVCFILVVYTHGENVKFLDAYLMMKPPKATSPEVSVYRMGFFWTLQVEFWFYLLAPFIFLTLKRRNALLALLTAIFVASAIAAILPQLNFIARSSSLWTLAFYANNFAVGGLCAILMEAKKPVVSERVAIALLAIGLAVIVACFTVKVGHGVKLRTYGVIVSVATGLCVLALHSRFTQRLFLPGMAYVGLISYSLYLIHLPVLEYFSVGRPRFDFSVDAWGLARTIDPVSVTRYILVCIGVASVSYFIVERPSQQLARWLSAQIGDSRKKPPAQPRPENTPT